MAFDPKANSLNSMRLALATIVAVAHIGAIAQGHQPTIRSTQVGSLAVDAFFVLSGFLVTGSFLRLRSVGRYLWHRSLRIMPAFWLILLLLSFGVAPLLATLEGRQPLSVFAGDDPSWRFAQNNAFLLMRQFDLAGLPTGTHEPRNINGALWTLYYEFVCYALVAALGVTKLLSRRLLVVALTVVSGALLALQSAQVVPAVADLYLRFVFMFLLGTLARLYHDRLPVRGDLAAAALVVTTVSLLLLDDYRPLGGATFAYLCLWFAVSTPWLSPGPQDDLSYGMYIYHWPVITLLTAAGAAEILPLWAFSALALSLVGAIAFCSWRLVERPALKLKDIAVRRPRAQRASRRVVNSTRRSDS